MRRVVSALLAAAITGVCLWFLLTGEVVASLRRLATTAQPLPILGAFVLVALVQWLRAWRFGVMTTGRLDLPGAGLVRIAFQLNALNFVLPFRLGELGYPILMRRQFGHDLLHAAGVLLLARLFDLAAVGAILLGSAAALRLVSGPGQAALVLGAAACALAPLAVALAGPALRPVVVHLPRVGSAAARLTAGLDAIGDRRIAMATVALSFAIWLTFGLAAILVARAVTDTVSAAAAMLGAAAGNVAFALPINGIAGIGPAQAAWVAATTLAGVPWEDAVVSALALHAVVLTNALVLGGVSTVVGAGRR